MPELILYHYPGACSQVSVCALEEARLTYALELVNLAAGEQSQATYRRVSPFGKVPTLLIDGNPLVENAAILVYVAALRPESGIFPRATSALQRAEIQSGLSFCGSTLHPQVRGIANPLRLTVGEPAPVRQKAIELARISFGYAEARIARCEWWLGEWSIIDVYVNWALGVANRSGFDIAPYPCLSALHDRLAERRSYSHMLEIDSEARKKLKL